MATKKQKRLAGEIKAAKDREEVRQAGLEAQKADQARREREFQMAAVARSGKKVHFVDPGPKSKIALEKEARVAKRLAESEGIDLARKQDAGAYDPKADPESFTTRFLNTTHDAELDLSSVDC